MRVVFNGFGKGITSQSQYLMKEMRRGRKGNKNIGMRIRRWLRGIRVFFESLERYFGLRDG